MNTRKIESLLNQINNAGQVSIDGNTVAVIETVEQRGSPEDVALELVCEWLGTETRHAFSEEALDQALLNDEGEIALKDTGGEDRIIATYDITQSIVVKEWE